MTRTKNGISLLLTVLLLLDLLVGLISQPTVYAEEEVTAPTITVETVSGVQGETVDVPVSISGNPGIVSFNVSLAFDDTKLKLTGMQNGMVLTDPSHSGSFTTNPYKLCFAMDLSTTNNMENGVIATLSFEILKSATPGDTEITLNYNPNEIYDIDYNNVAFDKVNGKIIISEAKTPIITVGTAAGLPGDTVDVPVSIANNSGIISLNVSIAYDNSKLELTGVTNGDVLTDPSHSGSFTTNPYKLCFNMDLSSTNITVNGLIATLTFKIISETRPDEIPITISYMPDDIFDINTDNVYFEMVNGNVYVLNAYTVTFKDYDGSVMDIQTITHGEAALAPDNPVRTDYDFIGWNVEFDNITTDLIVTAQYQIKTFTTSTTLTESTTTPTETITTLIETTTIPTETTTSQLPVSAPTKLSVTIKSVTPTTAKIFIERNGDVKGAISYVLLKGDYSKIDFSTATMSDMKKHLDFVEFKTSKWTKNCNFTLTYLDKNQTYTVIPITQRRGSIYFFGMGKNTTFTTPDITLETSIKKITADTIQFRLSRTGTANGALGYVLLKGNYYDINNKNLEEYTSMSDFVSYRTSNWTGGVTITNKILESNETYTIIPYTQKKENYYFGLGENIVFTAK